MHYSQPSPSLNIRAPACEPGLDLSSVPLPVYSCSTPFSVRPLQTHSTPITTSTYFRPRMCTRLAHDATQPPTSSPSQPIPAQSSLQSATNNLSSGTAVKILHQSPLFRPFTGSDPSYQPASFLRACEDAMTNAGVSSDADKIAFVRSHVVLDSLAGHIIGASSFSSPSLMSTYQEFRSDFMKAFSPPTCSSMEWIHQLRTLLETQFGASDRLRAIRESADIADIALENLDDSWFHGDYLPKRHLRSLIEFLTYSLLLPPVDYAVSSSIDFKPTAKLLDFSRLIGRKSSKSITLPVPPSAPAPSVSSVPSTTSDCLSSRSPTYSVRCGYCDRLGHSVGNCHRRKKQLKTPASPPPEDTQSSLSSSTRKHSSPAPASFSPRRSDTVVPSASSSSHDTSSTWCHFHDTTSHATKDCLALQALKTKSTQKRSDFQWRGKTNRKK